MYLHVDYSDVVFFNAYVKITEQERHIVARHARLRKGVINVKARMRKIVEQQKSCKKLKWYDCPTLHCLTPQYCNQMHTRFVISGQALIANSKTARGRL